MYLLEALAKKLEGEIAVAKANVEVYLNQSVGIGEHPDLVGAIEEQINSNYVSADGFNNLHKSAEAGWAGICDALINGGIDVNSKTNSGKTALEIAVLSKDIDTTRVLLHHEAEVSNDTLAYAVSSDDPELVELILNQGVDINYKKDNLIIDGNYILNKNVFTLHKYNVLFGELHDSLYKTLENKKRNKQDSKRE